MEGKKAVQLAITPDENLELRAKDEIEQQEKEIHDIMDAMDGYVVPASASPRPRKRNKKAADTVLMDFPDAMRAVIEGKTISKKEWDDVRYKCRLEGKRLCITKPDSNKWHEWLVSDGDMLGEDWFVV